MATIEAVKGKADAQSPAPAAKAAIQPLKIGDSQIYEIGNNLHRINVEAGIAPEELDAHPEYFNTMAEFVSEGDEIIAFAKTRKWHARFAVVSVTAGSVIARLAYQVAGAPLSVAGAPKPFPAGYHIQRNAPGEPPGFVVIRERDGHCIQNSGLPWVSYQEAYEQFLKSALFQNADKTRYLPA